jgi:cytoskeleton protein RodZ
MHMARKSTSTKSETAESEHLKTEANTPTEPIAKEIDQPAKEIDSTTYSRCGGVLKAERLKQKLDVSDVCSQLRLGASQIDALESDTFSKLPHPSIVRGFIRNYAKLLKIDAAPIVLAYEQLNPNSAPQSLAVTSTTSTTVIGESKSGFSAKSFIGLIALFALAAGMYYYYSQHIKLNNNETAHPLNVEVSKEDTSTTTEFALPPASQAIEPNATQVAPAESTTLDLNNNVASQTNNATETTNSTQTTNITLPNNGVETTLQSMQSSTNPTTSTVDTSVSPGTNVSAQQNTIAQKTDLTLDRKTPEINTETPSEPTKTGFSKLQITTTESTWVNITDVNGRKIYSQVLASGTTEVVNAKKPLRITIGNAPATTLSMDGQLVDLAPSTRNKVAKLKLN